MLPPLVPGARLLIGVVSVDSTPPGGLPVPMLFVGKLVSGKLLVAMIEDEFPGRYPLVLVCRARVLLCSLLSELRTPAGVTELKVPVIKPLMGVLAVMVIKVDCPDKSPPPSIKGLRLLLCEPMPPAG